MNNTFNPYVKNVSVIKNFFKRKTTLFISLFDIIGALSYIALAVLVSISHMKVVEFINLAITNAVSAYNTVREVLSLFGLSGIQISPNYVDANILPIVMSVVPVVLFLLLSAIAFVILFSKSKNKDMGVTPKAGLSLAFVLSVIDFICAVLGILSVVLMFFSFSFILTFISNTSGILIGIILAVISVYVIALYLFKMKFFKSAKLSVSSIEIKNDGAKAYAILETISAVVFGFMALSQIAVLVGALGFSNTILSVLGVDVSIIVPIVICNTIISVVAFAKKVSLAKLAFNYNKYINDVRYGFSVDFEEMKTIDGADFLASASNSVHKESDDEDDEFSSQPLPKINANRQSSAVQFAFPQANHNEEEPSDPSLSDDAQTVRKAVEVTAEKDSSQDKPAQESEVKTAAAEQKDSAPADTVQDKKEINTTAKAVTNGTDTPQSEGDNDTEKTIKKPVNAPQKQKAENDSSVEYILPNELEKFNCPYCKYPIKKTDIFCQSCGHKLK